MELKEYRQELLQGIRLNAIANSDFRRSEFASIVADYLTEAEEIDDFNSCYYQGPVGSRRNEVEIDGYSFDEFDGTFSVMVCVYDGSNDPDRKLTKAEITRCASRARRFIEGSLEGVVQDEDYGIEESEPAYELAELIREREDDIQRFEILIVSDLEKSDRIKSLSIESIDSKSVELKVWDVSNLYELEVSKRGFEDIEIKLRDFGVEGIPCIRAIKGDSEGYDAYMCAIPGQLLSDLYGRYGARLLESNVRSFLKLGTKTNRAIRATILKEPRMFFAYNNGITTTATSIDIEDMADGPAITGFTALQIVNGGQTTVTIFTVGRSRDKPDLSEIYVPMKITVISREMAEDVVPNISRSANTQNKVNESDFFSSSPFNKQMWTLSHRVLAPQKEGVPYATKWYYERTRGQYQQELSSKSSVELKKFKAEYPKTQLFTKTDLAKYRNSYDMKPDVVSKGAQYSLVEFSKSISSVDLATINEHYFKDTVALCILFRRVQEMVTQQPWYNGGYRAQIVTYTIAKLARMAKDLGASINLDLIWSRQALSSELESELVLIMEVVNQSITEDKEEGNVTQWCKKSRCWSKVQTRNVEILPEFNRCLVSQKKVKFENRRATRDTKVRSADQDLAYIVTQGAEFWKDAKEWGIDHGSLDWQDKDLLDKAIDFERKRPMPSTARKIVDVLEKLRNDGYPR